VSCEGPMTPCTDVTSLKRRGNCSSCIESMETSKCASSPMHWVQSPMTLFSAARTSNSRCLVLSALYLYLVQRLDASDIFFERSCPEHRPHTALEPQEPRSGGPWAPPPPPRGPREAWSCGRGVVARVSCRSYLCSREGGPHTLLTPETS
jgi:hypothetical protein